MTWQAAAPLGVAYFSNFARGSFCARISATASSATLTAPASTKWVSSFRPSGIFGCAPGSIHMKNFLEGTSPVACSHAAVARSRSSSGTFSSFATARTAAGYAWWVSTSLPAASNFRRQTGGQNRRHLFRARLANEAAEVVTKGRRRIRVPLRILLLFVIVRKLDYHEISRLQRTHDFVPASLIDEALGAASVHGVILHHRGINQELPKRHSPATLRQIERLVRHR